MKKFPGALLFCLLLAILPAGAQDKGPPEAVQAALSLLAKQDQGGEGLIAVWASKEFWAVTVHASTDPGAMWGYAVLRSTFADYLVFVLFKPDEQDAILTPDGVPMLTNDAGVTVHPIKVSDSVRALYGNPPLLLVFPQADSTGSRIYTSETKALTLAFKLAEGGERSFQWNLPLDFSPEVQAAIKEMDVPPRPAPAPTSFEEALKQETLSVLQFDLRTGFVVAPLPGDFLARAAIADKRIKNDAQDQEALKLLREHFFFLVMSFDKDRARLSTAAKGASAVGGDGRQLAPDSAAMEKLSGLAGTNMGGANASLVAFPPVGSSGTITLNLTDPASGEVGSFSWQLPLQGAAQ